MNVKNKMRKIKTLYIFKYIGFITESTVGSGNSGVMPLWIFLV